MRYKFTWKRHLLKKTQLVIGHQYDNNQDKMVLYLEDGGVREIKKWKDCECFLGSDWVASTKKNLESKVGQTIPLNV
jgi:hypothetical protein